MKLYFFGSEDCETCQLMLEILECTGITDNKNMDFVFIDAFDEDQQTFCDEHEVDEIPHVKLIDEKEIVFERIGIFHPEVLKEILISFGLEDEDSQIKEEDSDDIEDNITTYYDIRYFRSEKEE